MTLIRTIIFYIAVIISLRIMGKRQIGELQPGELVITILISECAAAPIQELDRPVINGIIAIFTLVILEILLSFFTLKFTGFRKFVDGQPVIIIKDGVIDQRAMKKLRLSVDDLSNNLRTKGFFKIEEIYCAIVETDGTLSVMPTAASAPASAQLVQKKPADSGLPCVLIGDGKLHEASLELCKTDEKSITKFLENKGLKAADVFIMTGDNSGNYYIVEKEDNKK